jgi:hypothetical protein
MLVKNIWKKHVEKHVIKELEKNTLGTIKNSKNKESGCSMAHYLYISSHGKMHDHSKYVGTI